MISEEEYLRLKSLSDKDIRAVLAKTKDEDDRRTIKTIINRNKFVSRKGSMRFID